MDIRALFDISWPIIQAPMAGVQGSALAIAVSNAGGLGSLPCATLTPSDIRKELAAIKARTTRPYNVNFFCHAQPRPNELAEARWREALKPYYSELGIDPSTVKAGPGRVPFDAEAAELLEEFRPPVVSFHFGLPEKPLLDRVRATGAKILSSATTLEEARWLEQRGVDAIIAQGAEAGGHRGMFLTHDAGSQIPMPTLAAQIISHSRVPVIVAGGIASAEGVSKALAAGAAGVQIGTAFLLCPEANTSEVHRRALRALAAGEGETALTNLFSGRLARGIVNRLMRELGPVSDRASEFPLASAAVAPLRAKAESEGSGAFSPLWSGMDASGCREIPAGELTFQLAAGLR